MKWLRAMDGWVSKDGQKLGTAQTLSSWPREGVRTRDEVAGSFSQLLPMISRLSDILSLGRSRGKKRRFLSGRCWAANGATLSLSETWSLAACPATDVMSGTWCGLENEARVVPAAG